MLRFWLIAAFILAVLASVFVWLRPRPAAPAPSSPSAAPGETLVITHDAAEIFRRAFWRHPAPDDRIVRAERREWSDAGEVRRWQWFIEVRPSAELLRALRDPTHFNLVLIETPRPWAEAAGTPAWFPATASSALEVHQAPGGTLTLLYRVGDNTLFATDDGRGFAAPVNAR